MNGEIVNFFSLENISSICLIHEYTYTHIYIYFMIYNFFLVTFRKTRITNKLPRSSNIQLRDSGVHEFYDIRLLRRFLTRVPGRRGRGEKMYEGKFIKKGKEIRRGQSWASHRFRGPRNSSRAVDNVFYFFGGTLLLFSISLCPR